MLSSVTHFEKISGQACVIVRDLPDTPLCVLVKYTDGTTQIVFKTQLVAF